MSDRYTDVTKSANWQLIDNSPMWVETTTTKKYDKILNSWIVENKEEKSFTPQLSPFKCCKTMDVTIILLREKSDDDAPTGSKTLIYLRTLNVKVKDNQENVWLTWNEDANKLYIKNLMSQFTYPFACNSDPQINVKVIDEKRITLDDAKKNQNWLCFQQI